MKRLVLDNIVYYNEHISYRKLKDIRVSFDNGKLYLIISDKRLDALLFSILIGLEKPVSGNIVYNDKVLKSNDDFSIYQYAIGSIIIKGALLNNENVITNYKVILSAAGSMNSKIEDKVLKLFTKYGIKEDILNKKVKFLSDEEQSYVLYILAIINEPDVIIVNDIFPNLKVRQKILYWLKELCEKKDTTVIFFTQERETITLGDEIWRFNDGRMTFVKEVEDK